MITTTILKKEPFEDGTKVVALLESEEVCSVEGKQVERIERGTDYHKFLHDYGIDHNHNRQSTKVTIFIENPFTEEKLAEALLGPQAELAIEAANVEKFVEPTAPIQEKATADGNVNRTAYALADAPQEIIDELLEAFPDVNLEHIQLIGNPVWNSAVEKTILTVSMWRTKYPENVFYHPEKPVMYRKYCMEDKKYFDKCYVKAKEHPEFLPDCCILKYQSFNMNVPEDLDIPDFVDYYFEGDPDHIEKELGLEYKRGKVSTKFGVTVLDGKIVRKKQYTYDEKSLLEDWG